VESEQRERLSRAKRATLFPLFFVPPAGTELSLYKKKRKNILSLYGRKGARTQKRKNKNVQSEQSGNDKILKQKRATNFASGASG